MERLLKRFRLQRHLGMKSFSEVASSSSSSSLAEHTVVACMSVSTKKRSKALQRRSRHACIVCACERSASIIFEPH
eukprot:1290172-Amphidinium_carterae.2